MMFETLVSVLIAQAAAQRPEVWVIDDSSQAVDSTLAKINKDSTETIVGQAADGRFQLDEPCKKGERLEARPTSVGYYQRASQCPHKAYPLKIVVSRKRLVQKMARYAKEAAEKSDYAEAALLYNEVWARAWPADMKLAIEARIRAIESFGRVMNVDKPTVVDPEQGTAPVVSPELQEALKKYQREKGLRVTGALDYATLSAAAETDMATVITKAGGIKARH